MNMRLLPPGEGNRVVPRSELAACPDPECFWIGEIDECETLLADWGHVFCPACSTEFEPVKGGAVPQDKLACCPRCCWVFLGEGDSVECPRCSTDFEPVSGETVERVTAQKTLF